MDFNVLTESCDHQYQEFYSIYITFPKTTHTQSCSNGARTLSHSSQIQT